MAKLHTNSPSSVKTGRIRSYLHSDSKFPEISYQRGYRRIKSFFKKITSPFRSKGYQRPIGNDAKSVFSRIVSDKVDQLNKLRSSERLPFLVDYYEEKYEHYVSAAMELCGLPKVRVVSSTEGKSYIVGSGSKRSTPDLIDKAKDLADLGPVALCYRFFVEGKKLPSHFLSNAIVPYFEDLMICKHGFSEGRAEIFISSLMRDLGVNKESDLTFEKMLEVKNAIRWNVERERLWIQDPETGEYCQEPIDVECPIVTPPFYVEDFEKDGNKPSLYRTGLKEEKSSNGMPAHIPCLEIPKDNPYQLDKEDNDYIQLSVSSSKAIKVSKSFLLSRTMKDKLHRLKRRLLYNKRKIGLSGVGAILFFVLTTIATGGIAAVVNLTAFFVWTFGVQGGHEAIRMIRSMKAMDKIEKNSKFAKNVGDISGLMDVDEKKFLSFMKACRYICTHESTTQIYQKFAEQNRTSREIKEFALSMSKKKSYALDEVIKAKEFEALYKHRGKSLKESFNPFDQFYRNAVGDIARMEKGFDSHLEYIIKEKFEGIDKAELFKCFNDAANDSRVTGAWYHLEEDKTEWLKAVFFQPSISFENSGENVGGAIEKISSMFDKAVDASKSSRGVSNEDINEQLDGAAKAGKILKTGVVSYFLGLGKMAIRKIIPHIIKLGARGVHDKRDLEISSHLPTISPEGISIFGVFFAADLFLEMRNNNINESRLRNIRERDEISQYLGFLDDVVAIKDGVNDNNFSEAGEKLKCLIEYLHALNVPKASNPIKVAMFDQLDKYRKNLNSREGVVKVLNELIEKRNDLKALLEARKKIIKDFTGAIRRERTDTEEIATLRSMTKKKLIPFMDQLMSFHKAYQELDDEIKMFEKTGEISGSPREKEADEKSKRHEAAVLTLRWLKLKFTISEYISGSIGMYHEQVQKKVELMDKEMATIIGGQPEKQNPGGRSVRTSMDQENQGLSLG